MRRTKIVATLGPSSDRPGLLKELLLAGVDVCRLNFSHGSADDHRRRAQRFVILPEISAGQWRS